METDVADWLDHIANQRDHGATGQRPAVHDATHEQAHLRAYLAPSGVEDATGRSLMTRKADKTGLIAWRSNTYSVPLVDQNAWVAVAEDPGVLRISDLGRGDVIAEQAVRLEKG